MGCMLQSRGLKLINIVSSLLLFWVLLGKSYAQTTLLPGDLLVVTANVSVNEFELIPLINIKEGTTIIIKGSSENTLIEPVSITFDKPLTRGQRLIVSNAESDWITKSAQLSTAYEKGMITLSQPDEGVNRLLFGFSWGYFDDESITLLIDELELPFLRFGEATNYQYHLKNGASGTAKMLAQMVANPANWKMANKPFNSFQTSLLILSGPVIVFDQNVSTISESDSIRLNVAIYEHDGSKLTVDAKLHHEYSTADTNDVNHFKKYTFNFTGLIGDAVYEKVIPVTDDDLFEDQETAFFELENLSAGQFGDFISHAAFILDNEVPDVSIAAVQDATYKLPVLRITNNERVYLNVNDWKIELADVVLEFSDLIEIAPFENQTVLLDDFLTTNNTESLDDITIDVIRILDRSGQIVEELKLKEEKNLVKQDPTESTKNKIDVKLGQIENDPVSVMEATDLSSNNTATKADTSVVVEKGWKPWIGEINSGTDQDVQYWDEKTQSFRELTAVNKDSAARVGLIYYHDQAEIEMEAFEQFEDSSAQLEMQSTPSNWIFTLSATDANENEIIDGAEGFNLVQNHAGSPIQVSALMEVLAQQVGENKVAPYVFDFEMNTEQVKTNQDMIEAGELFWILSDSVIERMDISISTDQLAAQIPDVETLEEPVSTLKLVLFTENSSQSTDIQLFDGEFEIDQHVPHLALMMRKNVILNQGLQFAYQVDSKWFSKLNLPYTSDAIYAIPLGIRDTSSSKMTLEIADWNLEGGWQLFIEHVETEEQVELLPGVNFSFEYFVDEDESESHTEKSIDQRYRLLMVPPGVELVDKSIPEQIELFQNYPNPFNPATTISFYLPEPVEVSLSVFNVVGQPVATLTNGVLNAGEHHFEWNATGYPSGMYIYQLEVGTKVLTRKMTLVK
jgi:hypothetical protein